MLSEPSFLGYLVFLVFVFSPGVGIGEALGIWGTGTGLAERLGLAFGLGLVVDTVILLARTSGVSVLGYTLKGMGTPVIMVAIGTGIVALLASVAVRRKFTLPVRPGRSDLIVVALMLFQGLVLLSYFSKYPIFPEYQSQDFGAHVTFTQNLISGASTSIPSGLLYYGVHYQLAVSLLLAGGEPLVTLQRTMAILVVLSPLLVYFATSRVFASRWAALLTTAIYSLSGTVWFPSVFGTGLFPNFFGILISLLLLALTVDLIKDFHSRKMWLAFLLALVTAYFSHFSTITILPALLVLPLVQFTRTRSDYLRFAAPGVIAVVPAVVGVMVYPKELGIVLNLAEAGGGAVFGSTVISNALSAVPVLGYMALEVTDDVAFVLLAFFAAVYVYRLRGTDNVFLFVPPIWLVALILAAPFNISAWRFSFEALVPLTLMAGYGLYTVIPKPHARRRGKTMGRAATILVLFLLLTPVLATSWGEISIADSLTNTQISANSQQDVYTALGWIGSNTPTNSTYLSVSDWRFTYSTLFFGRTTDYTYVPDPTDAVKLARQSGMDYIIVTNIVTVSLPPNPSLFPWNNYKQNSNITLVYSNNDVRVFEVL